jgi:glycosyltransferase involved in cell wall biosynthesis
MRRSRVFVQPSFFEGLVLVEALASGCRLVSTELAGVRDELASHLGSALELVPLPRLGRVDEPLEEDLPAFVDGLAGALLTALAKPPPAGADVELPGALEQLTWGAVFRRIESAWEGVGLPSEAGDRQFTFRRGS